MPNWHPSVIDTVAQHIWKSEGRQDVFFLASTDEQDEYREQALVGLIQLHAQVLSAAPADSEVHA